MPNPQPGLNGFLQIGNARRPPLGGHILAWVSVGKMHLYFNMGFYLEVAFVTHVQTLACYVYISIKSFCCRMSKGDNSINFTR